MDKRIKYYQVNKFRSGISYAFITVFFLFCLDSCKKYLDEPILKSQVVPKTLDDLQALLNWESSFTGQCPDLLEVLSDNYYITDTRWQSGIISPGSVESQQYYKIYNWDKDAYADIGWSPYSMVYHCNFILDILQAIPKTSANESQWNRIYATTIFYRAFGFYWLSQLFCQPYTSSASTDLGIPLRLSSDPDEAIIRSTVAETYGKIIVDVQQAAELLPESTDFPTQPNRAAAYGCLARIYLSMNDYEKAYQYADFCLKRRSSIMDYNLVSVPFPKFNSEIIFYSCSQGTANILNQTNAIIDTNVYQSYDNNDLRKTMFFIPTANGYGWNGSYTSEPGSNSLVFNGITTAEMYLIRAECRARKNDKDSAMADLNKLIIKRWRNNGSFIPDSAIDKADALNKILVERRKELLFRGLRWTDMRRLNEEGNKISPKRRINGVYYDLPAHDLRWVMLIPLTVINRSGIQQNPR